MQPVHEENASHRSFLGPSIIAGFVLLYFAFPGVFVLPVLLIFGPYNHAPVGVQNAVHRFFVPVRYLSDTFPIYRLLLSKEAELTGIR